MLIKVDYRDADLYSKCADLIAANVEKYDNCIELVKDIYLEVNKDVQNKFWDYYANKQYFKTKREDIRETFNQLYRDIQLQQILR